MTQAPYHAPAGVGMTVQLKNSHDVAIIAHRFSSVSSGRKRLGHPVPTQAPYVQREHVFFADF
jgi:hypothetical protein